MNLGRTGFDFSFSDVRILLPDAMFCSIIVLFMVFYLLCALENRWLNN
jgi:hypothetical protein